MKKTLLILTLAFSNFSFSGFNIKEGAIVPRINPLMHSQNITNAAISYDQHYLATVSNDKTAKLWDINTGKLLYTLRVPIDTFSTINDDELFAVAFDSKNHWVAVAGREKELAKNNNWIYFFNLSNGKLIHTIANIPDTVLGLCTSVHGERIAAITERTGVKQWNTSDWHLITEDTDYHEVPSGDCVYIDDKRLLTSSFDGSLRLYDANGHLVNKLSIPNAALNQMSVRVDSNNFVVSQANKTLSGLSLGTINPFTIKQTIMPFQINRDIFPAIAWSLDGKHIYLRGNYDYQKYQSPLKQLDYLNLEQEARTIKTFDYPIKKIFMLENGNMVVVTLKDFSVIEKESGNLLLHQEKSVIDTYQSREQFQISPDGTQVLLGYIDRKQSIIADLIKGIITPTRTVPKGFYYSDLGDLIITNWENSAAPNLNNKPLEYYDKVRIVSVDIQDKFIIIGGQKSIVKFDAQGKQLWITPVESPVVGINITQNSQLLISLHKDSIVRWYSADKGVLLLSMFIDRATQEWIVWSPVGYYNASSKGAALMGWHKNQKANEAAIYQTAESLKEQFYRPKFIKYLLQTGNIEKAIEEAKTAGEDFSQ